MITHLLDTSAILAHYFNEPGADKVHKLLLADANHLGICVVTLVELQARLAEEVSDKTEAARAFHLYANELFVVLPVDRTVADAANEIRAAVRPRLPLADALIAGCARTQGAILVHRDPHMAGIADALLRQMVLAAKR